MATVRELLRAANALPGRDAEILLCHCLNKPRAWLYTWPEAQVEHVNAEHFRQMVAGRMGGMPVAYLTGQREFWSLPLTVNEHTLIPRPETETIVEWALALPLPRGALVLDLGTGCGTIALAVASEREHWQVTAVDSSATALQVAEINAVRNGLQGVRFLQSDWYSALAGRRFDLLLSNPPYVDAADAHLQQGDLRFEPQGALVAAEGGLSDLAALARGAPAQLLQGGWLLMEHGCGQGEQVRALLQKQGFEQVSTRKDIAGQERITGGCWRAE